MTDADGAAAQAGGVTSLSTELPLAVRVQFAHAAIQVLAEDHGIDVLHIKGPAIDPSLVAQQCSTDRETGEPTSRPIPRVSIDADVLVRPSQVELLLSAMHRHGWVTRVSFTRLWGWQHASTLKHDFLGHADVHRRFPGIGIDDESAFDRMWRDRGYAELAGQRCWVPSLTVQRLILLLHAARGPVAGHTDITAAWDGATSDEQAALRALAAALGAEVPLAAAIGELDQHRRAPEHELWQLLSRGGSTYLALWGAHAKAAQRPFAWPRLALRLLPNRESLAVSLGRDPMPFDYVKATAHRLRRGVAEVIDALRDRGVQR